MTDEEKNLMKKWAETWKRAGPILEEIRKEELRNFDYKKTSTLSMKCCSGLSIMPKLDRVAAW